MAEQVGAIYFEVSADTAPLIGQTRVVERETGKMVGSFNAITAAIKVLAAALALVKMAQLADDMRLLSARVEVAAGSVEKGAAAMGELRRISQRTQTQLEGNVAVFNRLNSSILQMGGTQQDTLRITELLGMAIKVSGASGVEAASAMTQFGQALGSGKLAGDELRSLLENAPYLMQQLAAGIGVPVGALKQLGEEGKLTADVVTNALAKAAGTIEKDFQRLPQTFDAAMGGLSDAAKRANEALDTLAGSSAALTGVTRGVTAAVDALADQLLSVITEGDKLGKNKAVESWAQSTTMALSYVIDAADLTIQTLSVIGRNASFMAQGIGREIGGIAAQFNAMGEAGGIFTQAGRNAWRAVGEAMREDAKAARTALDAADAQTLGGRQLAGQRIRERMAAMATGTDGSDTMDRRARAGTQSTLKPPGATGDAEAAAKAAKRAADQRAKDYADSLMKQQAIEDEARELGNKAVMDDAKKREQAEKDRAIAVAMARDLAVLNDPAAQVRLDGERKLAALDEALGAEQLLMSEYAEARVALEASTAARLRDIEEDALKKRQAAQSMQLQGFESLFGSMAEVQKTFAGEQDGIYKALFAASKAFAIADSIIKIQQGIASAASLPFPANLGAMATVAAQTAGIVSTIKGANYGGGRQYGGPTSAGSLYRVNETGAPEMFTAANGNQYMLPTQSGSVTPADSVGGGNVVNVYNTYHFNGDTFSKADTIALIERGGQATEAAVLRTLEFRR